MPQYTFVVFTNPVAGREDAYNDWYNNQHLGDVTRIPGYVAAQRFQFVAVEGSPQPTHRYLALYTVETDDLAVTHKALMVASGSPTMPLSDAFDREGALFGYFRALGPVHKSKGS